MNNRKENVVNLPKNNLFDVLDGIGYKWVSKSNESVPFDPATIKFRPVNEKRVFASAPVPVTTTTNTTANTTTTNKSSLSNFNNNVPAPEIRLNDATNTINSKVINNNFSDQTNKLNNFKNSNNFNPSNSANTNSVSTYSTTSSNQFRSTNSTVTSNQLKSNVNSLAVPSNQFKSSTTNKSNGNHFNKPSNSVENSDDLDDYFNDDFDVVAFNEAFDNLNKSSQNFQTSSAIKPANPPLNTNSFANNSSITFVNSQTIENVTLNSTESTAKFTNSTNNNFTSNCNIFNKQNSRSYDCEIILDDDVRPAKRARLGEMFDSTNDLTSNIFDKKKQLIEDDCFLVLSDEDDIQEVVYKSTQPSSNNNKGTQQLPTSSKANNLDDLNDTNFDENIDQDVSMNISKLNRSEDITTKFIGFYKNDGERAEFRRKDYPFSDKLIKEFDDTFGLKEFRPNQLEAINAVLLKNDCFVLMPTGGGKSVCYQLPAIVSDGITIVISPLKSLIQDQIQKLNLRGVQSDTLSQEIAIRSEREIYDDLRSGSPAIKLLYVTPEKLSQSQKLKNLLVELNDNELLDRIVIDEAHCVSQWGHDFRQDYKKLSDLRVQFPNLPIMALTATATPRVRIDILNQLKMKKDTAWFIQSFNRPNLKFEVRQKKKTEETLDEIANIIKAQFYNRCGIIYCFSRKDCESVADYMNNKGIRGKPYHAGLTDKVRKATQENWLNGSFFLICATIAFGMGIDKADVRFVFHFSAPKSIEGYYQESGRAGRDRQFSACYLYYSYADIKKMAKMIEDESNSTPETRSVHKDNLNQVVYYSQNDVECRRVQVLRYFGEEFNAQECCRDSRTMCDNCAQGGQIRYEDYTSRVSQIVASVYKVEKNRNKDFTMNHWIDILKGSKAKKILEENHNELPCYAKFSNLRKEDITRLLRQMISFGYIREDFKVLQYENIAAYVRIGSNAKNLQQSDKNFLFPMKNTPAKESQSKSATNEIETINKLSEQAYEELIKVSKDIASKLLVSYQIILPLEALREISVKLPTTRAEFLRIPNVTKDFFDKHGEKYIQVTKSYKMLNQMQGEENEWEDIDENYIESLDESYESSIPTSTKKAGGVSKAKSKTTYKKPNWNKKSKYFNKKSTGNSSYKKKFYTKKKDSW